MVTKFLTDYFNRLIDQGKKIPEIKETLLSAGYLSEDIDVVISQFQSHPRILEAKPAIHDHRISFIPPIIASICIALSVYLFSHIFIIGYTFALIIKNYTKNNLLIDVFQSFPIFTFTPVFYAVLGCITLIVSFLLLRRSRPDLITGLISLIIILISVLAYSYLSSPVLSVISFPLFSLAHPFINPETVTIFAVIVILIFSSPKFSKPFPDPLPSYLKLILFPICLIFLSISSFIVYQGFRSRQKYDTNLYQLSDTINHKVYQLTSFPHNLYRISRYYSSDQPLLPDFITINTAFGFPSDTNNRLPSPAVIFSQSPAPENFRLSDYLASQYTSPLEALSVSNTLINEVYYLDNAKKLYFTSDSTLFLLNSQNNDITKDDLVNLATSLN